ncbi:MAG: hypothetical protein ABSF85_17960 [Terriglobales bacterium]
MEHHAHLGNATYLELRFQCFLQFLRDGVVKFRHWRVLGGILG